MTETNENNEQAENVDNIERSEAGGKCSRCRGRRRGRKRGLMTLLVVGGVIGGVALVGRALAGPGGHGCHGDRGPATVEEARAHASKMIDRVGGRLDATEQQKAAMNDVADAHVSNLVNIKNEARSLKKAMGRALMAAPKPDAVALEAQRQELVQLVDRGSKELLATLLETSDLLTDVQREKLRDRFSWWMDD